MNFIYLASRDAMLARYTLCCGRGRNLRAYSITEYRFGFTMNLVSDSVKKCIRITNPNLDSSFTYGEPACKSITHSLI